MCPSLCISWNDMRIKLGFGAACALWLGVFASASAPQQTPESGQSAIPTYTRDVAPILFRNCTSCHRPGEIAPMSLMTYEDVRPQAKAIRDEVGEGHMPPWHAEAPHGTFLNELRLTAEEQTLAAARRHAGGLERVAGERVFAELKRIVIADEALAGLDLLERAGATAVVLPELSAMHGAEQTRYHHRDVHGHVMEVLQHAIALERDPGVVLGEQHGDGVRALLAQPLGDELTRGGGLRFAALLHDVAKPATQTPLPQGGHGLPGHDELGARVSRDILARLRTGERLRAHVAALARHHLRTGFLVHDRPLERRAVHAYLVACAPVAADVTLLSVVDRLATRGRKAHEAIERHLGLVRELLPEALRWQEHGPPAPLVRGDELARALGRPPGPWLADALAELAEAQYAGEITTRGQALAHVQGGEHPPAQP